ncbi:hypothetical protein Bca4012_008932 [Brassica carinata]
MCKEEFTWRRRRLTQVQVSLTNVLTNENEFNDLLALITLSYKGCLCGFPFPCLKTIFVTECPEMRNLPQDSQRVDRTSSLPRIMKILLSYISEHMFSVLSVHMFSVLNGFLGI